MEVLKITLSGKTNLSYLPTNDWKGEEKGRIEQKR